MYVYKYTYIYTQFSQSRCCHTEKKFLESNEIITVNALYIHTYVQNISTIIPLDLCTYIIQEYSLAVRFHG